MPSFQYKAIDQAGRGTTGRMDAVNDADLEARLKHIGLDLVSFRQTSAGSATAASIDRKDVINFCFDIEQLARAGIPLVDGLRDLRDTLPSPRFRTIVASMLEDIEGGKLLSQAMSAFPTVFDSVFVNLVRAGEQTGQLEEVFENLTATLKWQDELASTTKKLLIYPAMVLVVVSAVLLFLLIYLVPQVVGVLKTMRVDLPWQTRALIAISGFVVNYWWALLSVPLLAGGAAAAAVKSNSRAAFKFDGLKLKLPVLGPILQKIILSRFANAFALMYRSGVTVLDAIRITEGVVGNKVVADGLNRAWQQINAGEPVSHSFEKLGLFPPLVIRMLRMGENTGALDTALLNISYFYNRDVKDSVDKALKMIEPALTLVLGGLLALIMFAVLSPVYDMIGKIKV
jgi:type IV pilus assembly protein PilC